MLNRSSGTAHVRKDGAEMGLEMIALLVAVLSVVVTVVVGLIALIVTAVLGTFALIVAVLGTLGGIPKQHNQQ